MEHFKDSMLQLITETSTNLPADVRHAIARAIDSEIPNTRSSMALGTIAVNIDMACENMSPICQDTGWPTFYIQAPGGANFIQMKNLTREAVVEATGQGKLRQNAVDSLTGKNSGDNLGPGTPTFHFDQWENKNEIEVKLLLKGGGCENKSIQYSLPTELPNLGKAGRNLDGIRKCLMHAVWQAQGHGCSIGVIGASIGGDRVTGYETAKQQLFRTLDDVNPDPELARLEDYVMTEANKLGIGTMGFGGSVTIIGCKVASIYRLPASFFVSVVYDCWAFRRLGVILDVQTGTIKRWLYREEAPIKTMAQQKGIPLTGREIVITTPLTEEVVHSLKVGDIILLNGAVHTGRDALHSYLVEHDSPVDLHGAALYHCGPVALKDAAGKWTIKAAGPTTSSREEPYQAEVIRKFGIRAVIGKGGMGAKTLAAMKEYGAVYLNAIGGAAQYYAKCIPSVEGVDFLEFGIPEAMWHMTVKDFAAIVTMDAHGNSLHADIEQASAIELSKYAQSAF
ncbi:MAG: fumarate hydratase [Bacteroidota bacterium]